MSTNINNANQLSVLVFGLRGWIGGHLKPILEATGFKVIDASVFGIRADNADGVENLLDELKPDRVLSLVGRTHGPGYSTIDYLEQPDKLVENINDNLFAPIVLAGICARMDIHFTYMGTGCIFCVEEGTDPERMEQYTEESDPDFFGSSYSIVKGFTDRLMRTLNSGSALNVRIRMPITSDMSERNFITKITKYERVCSIANSMTVLPILLPLLADMIKNCVAGTINLCNPGYISHNEILALYKKHVDPNFEWTNFTLEEQNKILLSKRSNNILDTTKLVSMYHDVMGIHQAVEKVLEEMKSNVGMV